ncbi:MAG: hypothetical protein LC778_19760 [Acidobacteria bacterium]|nr:hypothetical protein [Acidobacteriota bacterium]
MECRESMWATAEEISEHQRNHSRMVILAGPLIMTPKERETTESAKPQPARYGNIYLP